MPAAKVQEGLTFLTGVYHADIEEQEQQPEPVEALAIPAAVANLVAEQQAEEIRALDEEAQPDGMSTHLFPSSAINLK